MHTRRALILGVIVVTIALGATPLGADPWEPPSSGGGGGDGGFNAWAYWAAATGGRGTPTPETCTLPAGPGVPDPPPPAHIEYVGYEIPPGSGHYSVWKDCVADGHTVNPDLPSRGLGLGTRSTTGMVEAGDPQELINQALAHINPTPPAIGTSPAGEVASLVGVSTWLWLEGGVAPTSATITDGPLAVTVTATPVSVRWDPGDGGTVVSPRSVERRRTQYRHVFLHLSRARLTVRKAATAAVDRRTQSPPRSSTSAATPSPSTACRWAARTTSVESPVSPRSTIAVNQAQAINTGSG